MNIKPSRFGPIENLFATIEYCKAHRIALYGGGQTELGIGRDHIQALASLFYSAAANDVAPREYNTGEARTGPAAEPAAVAVAGVRHRLTSGGRLGWSRLPVGAYRLSATGVWMQTHGAGGAIARDVPSNCTARHDSSLCSSRRQGLSSARSPVALRAIAR